MNDNNILYCKSVEGLTRPARRFAMTFYDEMRALVLRHGAINNPYLDRFKTGALTDEEIRRFAVEFYNFARFFPKILVAQLVNTEDEAVADELTTVRTRNWETAGRRTGTSCSIGTSYARSAWTCTRPWPVPCYRRREPTSTGWNSSTAAGITPWRSALRLDWKTWQLRCGTT